MSKNQNQLGSAGGDPDKINLIVKLLKKWTRQLPKNKFHEAYVFGSLVNHKGVAFTLNDSDLDLVIIYERADKQDHPLATMEDMQELRLRKKKLEQELLQIHRRQGSFKFASILVINRFELNHGIHKTCSFNSNFFSLKRFVNLADLGEPINLVDTPAELPEEIAILLQNAQKFRHSYLNVDHFGENGYKNKGDDAVAPKEMLRSLAKCITWLKRKTPEGYASLADFAAYDVDLGIGAHTLLSILEGYRATHPEYDLLVNKVYAHIYRKQIRPLTEDDELLLWEIVSSYAVNLSSRIKKDWQVNFDSGPYLANCAHQTKLDIFYFKSGFTKAAAQSILSYVERTYKRGFASQIQAHPEMDGQPDAFFIGALVTLEEAKVVLEAYRHAIGCSPEWLFPLDYPPRLGGDISGKKIGVGYMAGFEDGMEGRKTVGVKVSERELAELFENSHTNTDFQIKLRRLCNPSKD